MKTGKYVKRNTESAIRELIDIHGDRYNYDKFVFVNTKLKSIITCKIHGDFDQSFEKHKYNRGCPHCAKSVKLTRAQAIKGFKETHKNRYDYSLVDYQGSDTKVKIICKDHGVFEQTPYQHKLGNGCMKCAGRNLTNSELIDEFNKVHNHKYDYSKVNYIRFDKKIIVTCRKHGDFDILASNHKVGKACPKCAGKGLSLEETIDDFHEIHGNKYNYVKFDTMDRSKKGIIICKLHGKFEMGISSHKSGCGCPSCSIGGFDPNKSAILYYIKVKRYGETAYKIGITNGSLKTRFAADMKYITLVKSINYDLGKDAYEKEQFLLKEFSFAKWEGRNLLKNGNTELFKYDILNLDVF